MLQWDPRITLYEATTVNKPLRPVGSILAVGMLVGLSACTSAPTPSAPTVAAVAPAASPAAATAVAVASPLATQVAAASPAAATVAVAASPAVATVVTAASPAVGTVVAAASPAAAPAVTAATAASPVRITSVQLSPTDTTITVQNVSNAAVDLTGWKLQVGSATAALPSGARVAPNASVVIHTGAGTSAGQEIYLGQDAATLVGGLRPGATLALIDAQGTSVAQFTLPG
jgi:hypothetical protein